MSFALYQTWLYMSVFSATKTFGGDGAFPLAPLAESSHALLVYMFLGVSSALLIAFGAFHKRATSFFQSRRSVAVAGLLGLAGTLLLQLGAASSAAGVAVAAACMGASASVFVVLLGNAFARFEFATCVLNAAVSVALGFLFAVAFVSWVPSPVSGFLAALMPVLMTAAFWRKDHSEPGASGSEVDSKYLIAYLRKFAASMLLFGVVVGALRVVCADRLLSGGVTIELVLCASCIVSVVPFVAVIALARKEMLWDSLFRTVMPLVFLGIACMAALPGDFGLMAAFFASFGFVCLATLLWMFLASLARSLNGSSVFVFGCGYGLMQATSIVGCVLANALMLGRVDVSSFVTAAYWSIGEASPLLTTCNLALLGLVLCVTLSFAYAITPRYSEMRRILSGVLNDMLRRPSAAGDEEEAALDEKPAEAVIAGLTAPSEVHEGRQADAGPDGGGGEAVAEEPPRREDKGSFVRRCDELSDAYGLSVREKEVFFLLAKGHNAAFITEKLCVSKSTAKTHINHIYKKMDIHTQQELLNMVEDRARGPLGADIDRDALREALRRANEEGSLERNPSGQVNRDYIGF